jgi:hypothetical protein
MFPGRSTPPLLLASFRAKPKFPRKRITGRTIVLNVWVEGHPSVLALALFAGSHPAGGARATLSERGADRIHNVLLAIVFGESGALFGKPLLLVRRSYAVQQTQRISQRWSGAPRSTRGDWQSRRPCLQGMFGCFGGGADAWQRTHAGFDRPVIGSRVGRQLAHVLRLLSRSGVPHCGARQSGVVVRQPNGCRSAARAACRFLLVKPYRSGQI